MIVFFTLKPDENYKIRVEILLAIYYPNLNVIQKVKSKGAN